MNYFLLRKIQILDLQYKIQSHTEYFNNNVANLNICCKFENIPYRIYSINKRTLTHVNKEICIRILKQQCFKQQNYIYKQIKNKILQ